jgi:hypothetical protein
VKAHGVVLVDGALESLREDHFQIPVPVGYERRSALRSRHREELPSDTFISTGTSVRTVLLMLDA